MRDNFLRDARVSQFGLFVWCANLAFFCTLCNVFICPSLYRFLPFLPVVLAENQSTLCRKTQFELKLLIMTSESASTSLEHKSPGYCLLKSVETINFKKWIDSRRGEGVFCAVRGVLIIGWARRLLYSESDRQVVLLYLDWKHRTLQVVCSEGVQCANACRMGINLLDA